MRRRILLSLIMLVAAYLRLHNLDWGLPEVFEEATPWRQAWEMWGFETGRLDFNPHFFNYPAFTFYIQWIGQALIYLWGRVSGAFSSPQHMLTAFEASPYRFFMMGRLITSLFGIASVYLVYRLGKSISSSVIGMVAALFLAFNFSHIERGQLITTDVPLVFFILLAFIPIWEIATGGRRRHYIWAGIGVGLATGVKYPGLLSGAGIIAAHVYYHLSHKHNWKNIVFSPYIWISAGLVALAFFVVSPFCFLDYSGFYRDFRFEQTHMKVGHFGAPERLVSYGRYLLSIIPGVLTLPILLLALGGLGYGIRRYRHISIVLLAFPLVYFAVIGRWKTAADHYILPLLPFLLLLAALPLWKVFDKIPIPKRWFLLGVTACLFVVPSVLEIHDFYVRPALQDNRTVAGNWIGENIKKGAAIAKEEYTPDLNAEEYLVFELPLSTVSPQSTGPFYDLRWYTDFDYIIISSEVYRRYKSAPGTYPVHVHFYRQLDGYCRLVKQFDDLSGSGPHIEIHRVGGGVVQALEGDFSPELFPPVIDSADRGQNAKLLCNLAIVLSRKQNHTKAMHLYRLAIAVDSTSIGAWHNMGLTLATLGRVRESEDAFKQALSLDSTYAMSWFGLGHLYRQAGRLEASANAFGQGLRYDPHRLDILRVLSEQYLRMGRTDDAISVAQRGLELSRGSPEFHFGLGCSYMVKEDYDKAIGSLKAAVEARPSDGRYAYSLAGAYYARKDYVLALEHARKAQEIGYDSSDLIDMLSRVMP